MFSQYLLTLNMKTASLSSLKFTFTHNEKIHFPDGPLLGKGSRVKRVKSAHQRAASAVAMSSEKQRLFTWRHGSSSSNTSMECGLSTPAAEFVLPPPYPDLPLPTPSAPPLEPTSVTSKPPSPPPKQRSTESVKSRPRPKTAKVNRSV